MEICILKQKMMSTFIKIRLYLIPTDAMDHSHSLYFFTLLILNFIYIYVHYYVFIYYYYYPVWVLSIYPFIKHYTTVILS